MESLADHADEVAARTGLHLSPHYAAPKLARLLDEVPDGRRRAADGELVAGTLDAFLAQRLTGEATTEPGHAGRTLLYNLDRGDWDPALCDLFGVPPTACRGCWPVPSTAGEWRGVPLVAAAGDQQAALLGHGGWRQGVVAAHFGTGAFVLAACGDRPLRRPGLLAAVLASTPSGRRFQLEGTVNSAGSAVDWACRLTGERLEEWEKRRLDPRRLPRVVPAFAGLGAPWWRPAAAAEITGLRHEHDGRSLLGGVLAGIAQRVLDCVEAIAAAGVTVTTLRVSGKLTRLQRPGGAARRPRPAAGRGGGRRGDRARRHRPAGVCRRSTATPRGSIARPPAAGPSSRAGSRPRPRRRAGHGCGRWKTRSAATDADSVGTSAAPGRPGPRRPGAACTATGRRCAARPGSAGGRALDPLRPPPGVLATGNRQQPVGGQPLVELVEQPVLAADHRQVQEQLARAAARLAHHQPQRLGAGARGAGQDRSQGTRWGRNVCSGW